MCTRHLTHFAILMHVRAALVVFMHRCALFACHRAFVTVHMLVGMGVLFVVSSGERACEAAKNYDSNCNFLHSC